MKREKELRAYFQKNQNRQIDIVDYLVQANGESYRRTRKTLLKFLTCFIKIDSSHFYAIRLKDSTSSSQRMGCVSNYWRIEVTEVVHPYYYSHLYEHEILNNYSTRRNHCCRKWHKTVHYDFNLESLTFKKINTQFKEKKLISKSRRKLVIYWNEQDIRCPSLNTLVKKTGFFEWPFDFVDEASPEKF